MIVPQNDTFGYNLTKYVQELYIENYKILMNRIKGLNK